MVSGNWGHLIGESDEDKRARRERTLNGPPRITAEQLRDEQVARELHAMHQAGTCPLGCT